MSEVTLGGYLEKHERAPAFTGSDGHPYSVGLLIEEEPDADGRYAAALVFVRWSPAGDRPVGHLDSEVLAWARSPSDAEERLRALSLYDVKAALDRAIAQAPGAW